MALIDTASQPGGYLVTLFHAAGFSSIAFSRATLLLQIETARTGPPSAALLATNASASAGTSPVGAIAGGVVGAVVLILLAMLGTYFYTKRKYILQDKLNQREQRLQQKKLTRPVSSSTMGLDVRMDDLYSVQSDKNYPSGDGLVFPHGTPSTKSDQKNPTRI